MSWYYFKPRMSVAQRRAKSDREVANRRKNGDPIQPVRIDGRKIAQQFWGMAWCSNLESYQDFAYRLDRGRSYVLNGSVIDLRVLSGKVTAVVCGSELYEVTIDIAKLPKANWQELKTKCVGQIGSLIELLRGELSDAVMKQVTDLDHGLFPNPKEIKLRCSCPDWAVLCKHAAAVLYGVGHRLDAAPELLFALRGVDHRELMEQALPTSKSKGKRSKPAIAAEDLGDIFGIDVASEAVKKKPAKKVSKVATRR